MRVSIKIHEADINRLQAYQYDRESKSDVVTRLLSDNTIDINKELFKEYIDEYSESYIYFEIAKREIEDKYIPSNIMGSIPWNIDFRTGIMTLDMDDLDSDNINRLEDMGFVIENC